MKNMLTSGGGKKFKGVLKMVALYAPYVMWVGGAALGLTGNMLAHDTQDKIEEEIYNGTQVTEAISEESAALYDDFQNGIITQGTLDEQYDIINSDAHKKEVADTILADDEHYQGLIKQKSNMLALSISGYSVNLVGISLALGLHFSGLHRKLIGSATTDFAQARFYDQHGYYFPSTGNGTATGGNSGSYPWHSGNYSGSGWGGYTGSSSGNSSQSDDPPLAESDDDGNIEDL